MLPLRFFVAALTGFAPCLLPALDTVLVFNEVHYHPAGEDDPHLEFVELYNQNTVNLDLSGWRLSGEVDFVFPAGTTIEGGSYLVVAANPAALEAVSESSGFLGPFSGSLGNGGGTLRIRNNNDRILDELDYQDRAPWPLAADGGGSSLAKRDPGTSTGPVAHWTHSPEVGGTPGLANFPGEEVAPPTGGNVALGKTVINGSSAYNGRPFNQANGPGQNFSAQNVTDGSVSDIFGVNYWLGTDRAPTQFFILDLGEEYDITEIRLRNTHNTQYNDRGTLNFTLSASSAIDGANLLVSPQTILSGTLSNVSGQNPIGADVFNADNGLTETTARYLRFDSLSAINNNAGLNEIEVYTADGDDPPPLSGSKLPPVTLNEIAGSNDGSFWVELHHAGDAPLDLTAYVLGFEDAGEFTFPAGTTIAPGGFLLVEAATLNLPAPPLDGENLILYQPEKRVVLDALRIDDLPRGRSPDGSPSVLTIPGVEGTSPGSPNVIPTSDAIVINEIMYHHRPSYLSDGDPPTVSLVEGFGWNKNWRFNQNGDDLGPDWADSAHPVGGNWESGEGPLGYEFSSRNPPEPIRTSFRHPQSNNPGVVTYYFETEFEVAPDDFAWITALHFQHQTDDGAVYYLNGREIHRYDMPAGEITAATLATNQISPEADEIRTFSIEPDFLVSGSNRLSVEVHQVAAGSNDIVMGLKLDLEKSVPGENPPTPYAENGEEWIELFNRSNAAVSLDLWELEGAVDLTFPVGTTMQPGEYLVIARNLADFSRKFPGVPALGDFSGSLSNSGETLLLIDEWNNPVDEVSYLDDAPWPGAADGGGSSLELRHPDLDNDAPSSWAASDETHTSPWRTYTYQLTAHTPTYRPTQYNFHEIRLGLLDEGEMLIDDFSVIEDPSGAALELIENGTFETTAGWRLLGTHQNSGIVTKNGNPALRISASSGMNYLNNLIECNLTHNGSLRVTTPETTYQVSFRAKWLSGSPQFRFESYYNKFAKVVILEQPESHGTPGARNSTWSDTVGPTLTGLRHEPAVPTDLEPITISVQARDPGGIDRLTLRYSVNGSSFRSLSMISDDGENYRAELPAQARDALVHFYVEAYDGEGHLSFAPPRGPDSRALIRVTTPNTGGLPQAVRVNMLPAEAQAMHHSNDILDNHRRGCTLIIDETKIAYDAGIRLRGSMWSRGNASRVGFNLRLPADRLFRGIHSTITLRTGSRRELAVKHLINASGGLHDNYNDFIQFNAHLPSYSGRARLEMTRFGGDYLEGLPGGDGEEGTVFKMEGIRIFQTTQDGSRNTPKLPFPIGWLSSFDLADQGDRKEDYRHNLRINTSSERDDYRQIIEMAKTFSLSGTELEDAAPGILNVDMWCRQFALLSLCGVSDTYSQGNPHNLNFYTRPDGLVEPMPWDWDNHFGRSTSASLWGNRNIAKLFARPVYRRLFHGHLHDLIQTTFNSGYLSPWFDHLGRVAGENYLSSLSYVTNRGNYVLSRLPAQIPFAVTTNNGNDFEHDDSTVTLGGQAWIEVKEIRLAGTPSPLPLTWLDDQNWEVRVPLLSGANPITLTALDFQGEPVGSDTITVTNTTTREPAAANNLVISEIHYHPAINDREEFLELRNISDVTVDLSGATFTDGIDFEFPACTLLAPGQHLLIVLDPAAFAARYGADLPVAGVFANGSRLANGGETIRLEGPGGLLIQELSYRDDGDWPESADGSGPSLVLREPTSNPDPDLPGNWRPSLFHGGSPGQDDPSGFTGDPGQDLDGDGFNSFAEYAMGTNDRLPGDALPLFTFRLNSAGHWEFTFPRSLQAPDVEIILEYSSDLETWSAAPVLSSLASTTTIGSREFQTHVSHEPASPPGQYVRVRFRQTGD